MQPVLELGSLVWVLHNLKQVLKCNCSTKGNKMIVKQQNKISKSVLDFDLSPTQRHGPCIQMSWNEGYNSIRYQWSKYGQLLISVCRI